MKIITVNLPESYVKLLGETSECVGITRSEAIRLAVRNYLIRELKFAEELGIELEEDYSSKIFDYCINCEKELHYKQANNHFIHKKVDVFIMKFCCSCYERFKDIAFDEFPPRLIKIIQKRINKYKKKDASRDG